MCRFNFALLTFAILTAPTMTSASTEEMSFEEVMGSFDGPLMVRVSEGIIRSIDLSNRTGIIGGHKYWFSPSSSETPLKVRMYQSEGGALELLQVGMEVEITYGDTGIARVAVKIQQLRPGAKILH